MAFWVTNMQHNKKEVATLALVALITIAMASVNPYYASLASKGLIAGIFALGINVIVGHTGLLPFCHAIFYALGAYVVIAGQLYWDWNLVHAVLVALVVVAFAGAVVGAISLRLGGLGFVMATLAFGELFHTIALRWRSVTGGSDGLIGYVAPQIGMFDLNTPLVVFSLNLVCLVLISGLCLRMLRTPFGHGIAGVRENAQRMEALGYSIYGIRLQAFIVSAVICGCAGVLMALTDQYAAADMFHWAVTGDGIVSILLGGVSTVTGPLVGALLLVLLRAFGSSYFAYWHLLVGVVLIVVVLWMPKGIVGSMGGLLKTTQKGV